MFLGRFGILAAYVERSYIQLGLIGPLEAGGGRAARQTAPTAHPLDAQKGGQNSSVDLDQTRHGAILRAHQPSGTPEPHLSGPILPCIHPERGNLLFWPLDAHTPQRAPQKGRKWCQT